MAEHREAILIGIRFVLAAAENEGMRALPFGLAALLALTCPAASAASAEEMLAACRLITTAEATRQSARFPQTFGTGYCWGAFTSIQRVIAHVDGNEVRVYQVCASANVSLNRLIATFVAFAKRNPQRFREDFFDVAWDSLRVEFPCDENGR